MKTSGNFSIYLLHRQKIPFTQMQRMSSDDLPNHPPQPLKNQPPCVRLFIYFRHETDNWFCSFLLYSCVWYNNNLYSSYRSKCIFTWRLRKDVTATKMLSYILFVHKLCTRRLQLDRLAPAILLRTADGNKQNKKM